MSIALGASGAAKASRNDPPTREFNRAVASLKLDMDNLAKFAAGAPEGVKLGARTCKVVRKSGRGKAGFQVFAARFHKDANEGRVLKDTAAGGRKDVLDLWPAGHDTLKRDWDFEILFALVEYGYAARDVEKAAAALGLLNCEDAAHEATVIKKDLDDGKKHAAAAFALLKGLSK